MGEIRKNLTISPRFVKTQRKSIAVKTSVDKC
jgi:hypothetical protein